MFPPHLLQLPCKYFLFLNAQQKCRYSKEFSDQHQKTLNVMRVIFFLLSIFFSYCLVMLHVPQFIQLSYHLSIQNLLLSGNIQQNGCIRPTSRHCKMLISVCPVFLFCLGEKGWWGEYCYMYAILYQVLEKCFVALCLISCEEGECSGHEKYCHLMPP